jgi:hypothetical protein
VLVAQNDEAKLVDLWLRCDEAPPRSYETRLDERIKKTPREARQEMDNGRRAMLAKRKSATGSANGLDDGGLAFHLSKALQNKNFLRSDEAQSFGHEIGSEFVP